MKYYIILTDEGSTKAPTGIDWDNLQVLGYARGNTPEEALKLFKNSNPYLKELNFDSFILNELVSETDYRFTLK